MRTRRRWQWAPVLAALVVGAGCNRTETPGSVAAPMAEVPGQPPTRPDGVQPDGWLTTQVQARFFEDAALRADDVDVSTENGVVTLSGTVGTEQVRTRAATLAQQVDGVTRVDNQITVRTADAAAGTGTGEGAKPAGTQAGQAPSTLAGRVDAGWTTTKIQAQYFADADVKGRNIDVTTDAAGIVTLRGRVDSEAARTEAVRIARPATRRQPSRTAGSPPRSSRSTSSTRT
jgi:hyperosmotically inducible protein